MLSKKKLFVFIISIFNCNALYAWQWPWALDLSGIYLLDRDCQIEKETFKKNAGLEESIERISDAHARHLVLPYITNVFTAPTSFKMIDVRGGFKLKQINPTHLLIDFRLDFLEQSDVAPQYRSLSYRDLVETVSSDSESFFVKYTASGRYGDADERYGDLVFQKVPEGVRVVYNYLNTERPSILTKEFVYVREKGSCLLRKVD